MFQVAKCSRKQNVLGSKMFQEAKCSRDQNVLRIKMFLGAKYESAKCVKKQSVLGSKVCLSQRNVWIAVAKGVNSWRSPRSGDLKVYTIAEFSVQK